MKNIDGIEKKKESKLKWLLRELWEVFLAFLESGLRLLWGIGKILLDCIF